MALTRSVTTMLAVMLTVLGGCEFLSSSCDESDPECLGRDVSGRPNGFDCERTIQCAAGLVCSSGTCTLAADKAEGETCARTGECEADLYCAASRQCEPAGSGTEGDPCSDSGDCTAGLRCDLSARGLPLECVAAGDRDINQTCDGGCLAGLACLPLTETPTCQNPPAQDREIPTIPTWDGASCGAEDEDAVAYFDVSATAGEFYRLPFPSDIRLQGDGTVDLTDHPRPPSQPIAVAANFLDAADGTLRGFSTNPVVYFRFSRELDFSRSVREEGARLLVDITPDSPDYDQREKPEAWPATDSNYICNNWLALQRPVGRPLRPGTTYAAIISRQVTTDDGSRIERSVEFAAMLSDDAPDDSDLLRAYQAFAPLRAWIDDSGYDADSILVATVFTTMEPQLPVEGMASVIETRDAPPVQDLTVCEDGVTSPCETTEMDRGQSASSTRGACAGGSRFTEIHGRITLPMFQRGTLPYEETGGGLDIETGEAPQVTGTQDVCFALAVPDGTAPEDGWPLLIYGHGTGGSFTATMGPGGLAEDMATGDTPAATLAIDLPQHGARRGGSDLSPDVLFFNVLNPAAARGNVLQGSADLLSLVAFAKRGGVDAGDSPTGDAIGFDADRIAIMGHSQGATHAALMLPYAPNLAGGVLSGVGGHLGSSLARKSMPLDIAGVLGLALFDPRGSGTELAARRRNPALAIIQWFNDAADPINFARNIHLEPTSVSPTGLHLMMSYGVSDTYAPGTTQVAYARAARLPLVGSSLGDPSVDGDSADPQLSAVLSTTVASPASETVMVGGAARSVGVRQYAPVNGADGHFVAVRNGQPGRSEVVSFLRSALSGSTPAIGQ